MINCLLVKECDTTCPKEFTVNALLEIECSTRDKMISSILCMYLSVHLHVLLKYFYYLHICIGLGLRKLPAVVSIDRLTQCCLWS